MQEKMLRVLELRKVIDRLKKHASCSLGLNKIDSLMPFTTLEEVTEAQEATDEGVKVLRLKGQVPFGGIFDISSNVKRSKIGSLLNEEDLMDIASTLYGEDGSKDLLRD